MNKFILSLGLILIFSQIAFADELQGGITYDVNSARVYVQDGQVSDIGQQSNLYYSSNGSDADIRYGYKANNVPDGFVVRYKDDLTRAYIYGMDNKLKYVDKYDKSSDIFPHRGYKYAPSGKLVNTSLSISKGNSFVFTPKGKLIARFVDGIGYLGNTNIVICSQSNY